MEGHLSAVIQLGDYATVAKRFLDGNRTRLDEAQPVAVSCVVENESRWVGSKEGGALILVAKPLQGGVLNDGCLPLFPL